MIQHRYINASDNLAQYEADTLDRQEVTAEWWMAQEMAPDRPLWVWMSDEAAELGLEPWRLVDGPDDRPNRRYFIQRRDWTDTELPEPGRANGPAYRRRA